MPDQPTDKLYKPLDPPTRVSPCPFAYAELDVTTNYSFLRGASHPDEYVHMAAELGLRALAITDVNSLAGVVRAHEKAKRIEGFQLIVGARLAFCDGTPDVLVWPTDREAYARLCRLITTGRRRAPKGECHLALADFLAHAEGQLAAVCGSDDCDGQHDRAIDALHDRLGDDLSLAVSLSHGPDDASTLASASARSWRLGVPLVATNHVHYHCPTRRKLHDVVTCTRHNCTIHDAGHRLFGNGERYMKEPEQMHRLFARRPEAIGRGLAIAARCRFTLDELKYEYPTEAAPAGVTPTAHLRALTYAGAIDRYPHGVPQKVTDLIEKELAFIERWKNESYFLTVHDLVRHARSRGILCQGRGSAANSAVCYCLGVTAVDPDKFQLVFARFASDARDEPPDIDIDFEHERREEVIQYVYAKYGRERAGMTASLITYRGRSAIRDVGKALGLGGDALDTLADKLDWWHKGTLDEAHVREAGVDPHDPTIMELLRLTQQLLGFPRHLSQHVGGMVIARRRLDELVPIENASMADRTVIEWDKDDLDTLRMFKVDILALGMMTAISKSLELIAAYDRRYELHTLPFEDAATYEMATDADTVGVFQIESRAQMSMLPRMRPREFYDLVVEVAIVRPGPIQGQMVHPYLRRRELKQKNPNYEPPYEKRELRDVLHKTLGVPLFQEQAMQMSIVAAGFSEAEADHLRRAMAAWKRGEGLGRFEPKFIDGMLANGYSQRFAERCFKQISGFGEYGFPESHAASFAKLVYASCWIKRHHPAAFCCALLNSQPMGFYAPAQLVRDAREHGVEVRPVDVNHSDVDCTLEIAPGGTACPAPPQADKRTWGHGGPALRLGLRMVRGLQREHADRLVRTRGRVGAFRSIEHFHATTDLPVSSVAKLSEADAFASLALARRHALWETLALPDERLPLTTSLVQAAPGRADRDATTFAPHLPFMSAGDEIKADYGMVGLSLKGHPVGVVRATLAKRRVIPAADLSSRPDGSWVRVAGLVLIRQRPGTASGVVFITLEDETGIANLIVRPTIYDRWRVAARHAALLQADGFLEREGQVQHVMALRLHDLTDVVPGYSFRSRDFH